MYRKVNSKVNRVFNIRWFMLGLSLFFVGLLIFCLSTSFPSYGIMLGLGIITTLSGLLLMSTYSQMVETREDSMINKQSTSETIEKAADGLAKDYHEDKDMIKELLVDMSNYKDGKKLERKKTTNTAIKNLVSKDTMLVDYFALAKNALIIDFIKAAIEYEIASHENTYHLDNDCTPVKERELMEEAKCRLMNCSS